MCFTQWYPWKISLRHNVNCALVYIYSVCRLKSTLLDATVWFTKTVKCKRRTLQESLREIQQQRQRNHRGSVMQLHPGGTAGDYVHQEKQTTRESELSMLQCPYHNNKGESFDERLRNQPASLDDWWNGQTGEAYLAAGEYRQLSPEFDFARRKTVWESTRKAEVQWRCFSAPTERRQRLGVGRSAGAYASRHDGVDGRRTGSKTATNWADDLGQNRTRYKGCDHNHESEQRHADWTFQLVSTPGTLQGEPKRAFNWMPRTSLYYHLPLRLWCNVNWL